MPFYFIILLIAFHKFLVPVWLFTIKAFRRSVTQKFVTILSVPITNIESVLLLTSYLTLSLPVPAILVAPLLMLDN
jgi:hypothetical protein